MEGFKPNQKMKSELPCYKAGGYVTKKELVAYEKKEDRAEEKKDIAEDKKIAKKAIAQHESAQHKGEPKTEIKLKAGRRVKKEGGCAKKYKAGGKIQKMAEGRRPWINEEPDDATAPIKKPIRKPKPKAFESEATIEGYAPGGVIPDAVTRAGIGGLGNAINTGPLGAAGSMGAPRNVPLSPQEQDIMRGLQAVGSYCKGGKAH